MNNDFANIPRDYGATLFLGICETNLWQISKKLPSRRTFNTQSLPMVLLLKQMMSQFLKPKVLQKKTVAELLKLDMKHSDSQLKDSELEIGLPTKQALNDVKNSGMQKQCYLGIRTFFTETLTYMQKSLALRNPLIEALTCLDPAEKAKITSVEKIRKVGDSLPCIKPEELTVLTDEWGIYAETDIPEEWAQKDGSAVRVDQYWSKVLKLKSIRKSKSSVCLER